MTRTATILFLGLATLSASCQDKYAAVLPQRDPALRKTREQFKTEAAGKTYPADAPKQPTDDLRAQVGYHLNVLEIANLSDTPWNDVDVWVNQRYVVRVPSLPPKNLTRLWFRGLYDKDGHEFPSDNLKTLVTAVEVFDGQSLHPVKVQLAD